MARYPSVFSGGSGSDSLVFWNSGTPGTGFFFQRLQTGIYFDNIRLDNPEPFWEDRSPVINSVQLLSGKQSVQSSYGDYSRPVRISFRCMTSIHYNITLLRAKMGAKYDLIVDEYTYENCYISSFREIEWFMGEFIYEISFVQDTA